MGRRHNYAYTGLYTEKRRMHGEGLEPGLLSPELTRIASSYFWTAYSSVNYHYIALFTVCLVVLLSYMLPNISHKIHRTTELKAMKKMLDVMAKEVTRAEVACLTVADQIGCFGSSMHDDTTETVQSEEHQDLAMCTSDSIRATQSAPVPVQKKMGFFRRIFFPNRNPSNKEIALMSYLYTDSFDKNNKNKPEANPAEPRDI